MKKRLKALEPKVAQEGLILTEGADHRLGQKAKAEREAHGEFGNECPGYWRSGQLLFWQHERGRPHLSADFHRHLFESDVCETL
jgi:hypothetical protein